MREEKNYIALNDYEHGIVIDSLNDKRNDLLREGKTTDAVDEVIVKIGHAPKMKFKVIERDKHRDEAR